MLRLIAPAKLNLFLHINYRRPDGYHELQTLFQLLDYGDELQFEDWQEHTGGSPFQLTSQLADLRNADNLISKAADSLVEYARQHHLAQRLIPIKITLTKHLPTGGGVGGGSSDAATTLLALNQLWRLELSSQQLAAIGVRLGADIPVFTGGQTAYAEGIGERLQTLNMPELWYVVIRPDCQVSTAEVFSHKELTRDTPKSRIATALGGDLGLLALGQTDVTNDCKSIVCRLYPAIQEAMGWLNQFSPARLTGTGACIFACFTDKERANHVFSQLPANYQGFVAKGINQSPTTVALRSHNQT